MPAGRPRAFHVILDKEEVKIIKALKKKMPNDTLKDRCSIILAANETNDHRVLTYEEIAKAVAVSQPTVISTLKSFVVGGLSEALTIHRNPNSDVGNLKFDGTDEARIIAKACSPAPSGRCRWTLKLLASSMTLILEKSISPSTVQRKLIQNELRPHLTDYWCIPPKDNAEFAYKMEDVLNLYQQPFNHLYPLICMDEKPYQLLDNARKPLPRRPGDIKKVDSEYIRDGTVSIFCFILPHTGKIYVSVEETRTAVDWANKLKWIRDEIFPDAKMIILVCDNLNTHTPVSLYKAFSPSEAYRIASAFEVH